MISILCFRCSRISTSLEGLRCFYCDNDESRTVDHANFHPSEPEHGNVSPGYYVPAADASTQTFEDDFILLEPTREASTQTIAEDFILLEPTREASTQTTDADFNLLAQTAGCHGYENCTNKHCTSDGKTSQDFDQVSTARKNRRPANPNRNEDTFPNQSYDICNSATVGTSRETAVEPHVASEQRAYLYEQSSIDEYENKAESDGMLRRHGTMEPTEYANKVGKLDFAGSNLFQLEYSTLDDLPNSSINVEGQEKDIPPVVSSVCQRNPSISKRFQENLVTAKTVAEENVGTSYVMCGKCRRYFFNESTFYAHMQNNCDPNPFKCDKCDEKFRSENVLMRHQPVHTGEKPFKCSHCDYASAWPHDLDTHMKNHIKK